MCQLPLLIVQRFRLQVEIITPIGIYFRIQKQGGSIKIVSKWKTLQQKAYVKGSTQDYKDASVV